MSLDIEQFTTKISNTLTATGENYTAKTIDLGDYGTSCEVTKHGSDRELHLTPTEDGLIDMVLFDGRGTAIANGTLFDKIAINITTEKLTNLITICF